MKYTVRTGVLLLAFCFLFWACDGKPSITYPEAKKVDQVDDYHGTKVRDPYRWMEEMDSPETLQWINAQEKLTAQYMDGMESRSVLKKRLTQLWNYETFGIPRKVGEYYVFTKNDGLRDHFVLYIQKGRTGKAKVLLDPNTFSEDGSVALVYWSFSKDHKYMSYAITRSGSDWREIHVVELKTGTILKDHLKWMRFSFISWYKDGFYYSRYDETKENDPKAALRNHKLYYHKLGTPQARDKLVYQYLENPKWACGGNVSSNEEHLAIYVSTGAGARNLLFYKKPGTDGPVTPIIDKSIGIFDFVDQMDGRLLVLTDYKAPRFRLVSIDPNNPAEENWKVVLPEAAHKLTHVSVVGNRLIARYLKDATGAVTVYGLNGEKLHEVTLPGVGRLSGFQGNREDNEVFYSFSTFNVPTAVYRYDIKENKSEVFREPNVKFNPDDYITKQVFYASKDKTRVPLFIAHKKGIKPDGTNPTLLFGYGGFNMSRLPFFRPTFIVLMENGGIFAMPCIRGGGEYGEEWHRGGMRENKQNSFDDFIGAAQYLVREKYTSPKRLAIWGVSNGGIMIGAVINQRPDLFGVAFPSVGVMDMLRFQKHGVGWAWVNEYGVSEKPEQFKYLYAYSPLHNIKEGVDYPAVLVMTSDHDNRVIPAHSYKYLATLQEKYKGKNPVLLRLSRKTGHSAGASLSKEIDAYTDILSFMFHNMNIKPTAGIK